MSDEVRIRVRPVSLVAAVLVIVLGVWMLLRQDLYISTGIDASGLDRSVNLWGLGIGVGLILGGAGGFIGSLARSRVILIASGLLICLSGMWHPLLWPALLATVPMYVLATSMNTSSASSLSQPA